ncbi:MAG: hypothetical protein VX026_12305, partial [Myxococcota bacterium]|nr:hypothetical protein [Myxococcota bacterium]
VVILNTAPTITNVGISPSSPSNTDTLTCNYTITDPDESPNTTVVWTNNTTGATLGNSDSLVLTTATASVSDSITCSVTTTDSDGANDSGSASTVIINRLPVVNSVTISPSSASNVDTLTCSVDATDADGDSLTTSYAWTNVTTGAALGATDTLVLDSSIATPTDEIQCAVSIDDGNTGTDSGSDSIIINHTTPTVSNVSISPSTALTDSVLSCSGTATDADEDSLTITYEWRNGSNILGNSDTLSLNNTLASPSDSITCIITASDPHGASASDSDSVVVDNIDPTVDSVSISPSTAVHGDTLTCLASASDADGGSPTLSYVWTINGSTESTTDTLVLSNAIDGDAVVCSVTATDADGGTDTGSDSLTVDNTAPATDTVSLSPVSVTSQTPTVTCTATGSDVDNDPLTYVYEWLIDTQVQSETSNMLNGPFAVDSVLACTVTTNDGKADGNTLSATTTVENTDPTIDSVSITPDSGITTTTSLSCLGNASDVDGGSPAISYEWTVSGNVVGSAMQLNL